MATAPHSLPSSISPSPLSVPALPTSACFFPFLSVFKDGHFLESFALYGQDFFVLGRHSNCDIVLSHPSISRHHLEIQVLHVSQELLLTDLDSVHGTSVNGTVLSPLKVVKAKEGDSIKLGASTRTYVVQWLPPPAASEDSLQSNDLPIASVDSKNKECWNSHGHHEHKAANVSFRKSSYPDLSTLVDLRNYSATQLQTCDGRIIQRTVAADCNLDVNQSENDTNRLSCFQTNNAADITYHRHASCMTPAGFEDRSTINASGLWLRRSKLNPPPRLLTSLPVPIGSEGNSNNAVPSAPPLPSGYSHASMVPSAPPLSSIYPSPIENQDTPLIRDRYEKQVSSAGLSVGPIHGSALRQSMTISEDTVEEYESDKENGHAADIKNYGLERNPLIDVSSLSDKQESQGIKGRNHSYLVHQNDERGANSSNTCPEGDIDTPYVSDKENEGPSQLMRTVDKRRGTVDRNKETRRIPFQSLSLSSKPPTPSRRYNASLEKSSDTDPSPVTTVDKYMSRKFNGVPRISEPRRLWHIVVDVSCFLDLKSFDALKSLEGIREVRLIVPKIVISDLDCFKAASLGNSRMKALKWIESCMVKHPSWIHVQSSSEGMVTAVTPPQSPLFEDSRSGHFSASDLMSPTNSDHVLNYALQFSSNLSAGKIALLTNDTALRIKAMAEGMGLVSDPPVTFCESLLNPYSERFLWSGSVAHGYSFSEKTCQVKSTSGLAPSTMPTGAVKETIMDTVKAIAARKHHIGEGLKRQCHEQAPGLKLVLT